MNHYEEALHRSSFSDKSVETLLVTKESPVLILGAGLAGLSAAINLAENGIPVSLISNMPSERAGSCMAEGGLNAALDHMGEGDSVEFHFEETMEAGRGIQDPEAVHRLTQAGPEIVDWLTGLGVRFNLTEEGEIAQRAFGGQKFKRTVHAKDSTGKQIMTALIDAVRKYEVQGIVTRYSHHSFLKTLRKQEGGMILVNNPSEGMSEKYFPEKPDAVCGCVVRDDYTGKISALSGSALIIACGGMHGLFGNTTGARNDNGFVQAELFSEGVRMNNLEFIQYHPTTVSNGKKRMLITEAARAEGGRLCVKKPDGTLYYFMEEKYPRYGNLMSRDITAREVHHESKEGQVYLDLRNLEHDLFDRKLKSTWEACRTYLNLDPANELIPVHVGIHYFMGGIDTDCFHRTNVTGLYAAGECAGIYHGANRLGGNSLLGAIFGGRAAAESVMEDIKENTEKETISPEPVENKTSVKGIYKEEKKSSLAAEETSYMENLSKIQRILSEAMSVEREEASLKDALMTLNSQLSDNIGMNLACAILQSAIARTETRGAHYRVDYPEQNPDMKRPSKAIMKGGEIIIEI